MHHDKLYQLYQQIAIIRKQTLKSRVRIVKNELGGSATQQELRDWGVGGRGVTMGTGELGWGVKPPPSIRTLLKSIASVSSRPLDFGGEFQIQGERRLIAPEHNIIVC